MIKIINKLSTKRLLSVVLVAICGALISLSANALTINVVGSDGAIIGNYRYLIEENVMHNIVPGETCMGTAFADCLSIDFHRSYMPVISEGHVTGGTPDSPITTLDPAKRYHVSVLPDMLTGEEYTIGGGDVAIGQASITIELNPLPLPTAQIRIFVFNDNAAINGAPDTPQERGIDGTAEAFEILLEDAGGRTGAAGQQIVTDVYGNPLSTTYNPDGSVLVMGDGTIKLNSSGQAVIQNLWPGKYGISVVPPAGSSWIQTSTIEGKHIIDAWVKANEPAYFAEFGPPGPHVFIGFVKPFADTAVLSGGATVSGQVHSIHNSRPPDFTFYTGPEVPGCWVGLNDVVGGLPGVGLYAAPCADDSTFSISNVPAGVYQLAIWDKHLDYIMALQSIEVTEDAGGSAQDLNLLDVSVFAWFARLEQYVYLDQNEDGIWDKSDPAEVPLFEQGSLIRWRDGTVYQEFPTDLTGVAPYDEAFPFFNWLVAEVGFDRFKATGLTVQVDGGGPVAPGEVLNPQPQSENGGADYRVETGVVLTTAFQGMLGQTNILEWGKKPYAPGENGGISGIVFYAITRAEDDPALGGAEPWEPGIPRIQVALYQDGDFSGSNPADAVIDDLNTDGGVTYADVDNYPYGFASGAAPGAEDFDYNSNGTFDQGDAIAITYTDSWDDAPPSGCQGEVFMADGTYPTDCYDGLRNFNQVRPGVFDGGYAFDGLVAGTYIVGTGEHPVYTTMKEEDRNVDFGDTYVQPNKLPPKCVGEDHLVADALTLFPLEGIIPFRAGQMAPLCDHKQVQLNNGQNAAADFFLFTFVPVAGHVVGFILDDFSNEFDPNSPNFGEKYSPPYIPVSIRDFTGREISRTYSDRWGKFNALVPSTYTTNLPMASGMSPNMLTACMNDPGPIPNGLGGTMIDPFFQKQYSQFCYTLQYMPGTTTYLDTPVIPVAAFAGPNQSGMDCELPNTTPMIFSTNGDMPGPHVAVAGDSLRIVSVGTVQVSNPDYTPGSTTETPTIARDFGFGATVGTVTIDGVVVATTSWDDGLITVPVPTGGGQLIITRSNGVASRTGITVHVGGSVTSVAAGGSIQDAIDLAAPGSIVLVPPGTYNESVIMWKPITLQGSGASTVINAVNVPAEKLAQWFATVEVLITNGDVDLVPGQEAGFQLPEPDSLFTEAGAGVFVMGRDSNRPKDNPFSRHDSRIDGISITGADNGGGITVNGFAHNLQISNNRLYSNYGVYGGGIRLGNPLLAEGEINTGIVMHHNYVAANGGGNGAGGGISLNYGSDDYQVTDNWICGNFTAGHGAGIGHLGLSDNGLIEDNMIVFNQNFNQGNPRAGGGIFIGGVPHIDPQNANLAKRVQLTKGSGSVKIIYNQIIGNNSGSGNGGGISLGSVSGQDTGKGVGKWHTVDIFNNIINNNVAGLAGGGITLQDAAKVNIVNNTVAHNDSTATAGEAFTASPNQSTAQPAGVVSYAHSTALSAEMTNSKRADPFRDFSNPLLANNIIWQNRSFYFTIDETTNPPVYGLVPDIAGGAAAVFNDLAVIGFAAGLLNPTDSVLTDTTGYAASNTNADPLFVLDYFNGQLGQTVNQVEINTSIQAQPAFDEGGNFIDVRFSPLQLGGDYHIGSGSSAINNGDGEVADDFTELATDIDGDVRDQGRRSLVDSGADEAQ